MVFSRDRFPPATQDLAVSATTVEGVYLMLRGMKSFEEAHMCISASYVKFESAIVRYIA